MRQPDEGDTTTFPEAFTPFQTLLDDLLSVTLILVASNSHWKGKGSEACAVKLASVSRGVRQHHV